MRNRKPSEKVFVHITFFDPNMLFSSSNKNIRLVQDEHASPSFAPEICSFTTNTLISSGWGSKAYSRAYGKYCLILVTCIYTRIYYLNSIIVIHGPFDLHKDDYEDDNIRGKLGRGFWCIRVVQTYKYSNQETRNRN